MTSSPPIAEQLAVELSALSWATDLLVAGSVATGDYRPGVSDLDLVAIIDGPVDAARRASLATLHRRLDEGPGRGLELGCVYVAHALLLDPLATHPTWTHGQMVDRILSGITRAELVLQGYALYGHPPDDLLPAMNEDDVREAGRAELTGYWTWAARRPRLWLNPVIADLGLTSMARGRHTLATGTLLTKTAAIERADAPAWLIEQLRARRRGEGVSSPRLRTAHIAWRDACRTVAAARAPF
ncbi:MAG TPA: nucleotidyltransferase domain-containing protein [Nocardioides sp.]|nr:nucleotidyltransferase domain-containing protein [Nocardioides sp.]